MDTNTASVLGGAFAVLITALQVYQSVKLHQVQEVVNGTHEQALVAAHNAGIAAGILAGKIPPGEG